MGTTTSTQTLTLAGTPSGIDTKTLISELVAVERQPEQAIQQHQSDDQTKLSTLASLISGLQNLQTASDALTLPSDLKTIKASSSQAAVAVSATGTATVGTHTMIVAQLAQAQTSVSGAFASDTAGVAGAGSLQFTVGSGAPVTITFSGSDTLDDIAARISAAGAGISASVVFDGTNYHIVVNGTQTGAANGISFAESDTQGPGLNMTTLQSAQNASFSVDNLAVTRPTNSFNDVVPGLNITLQGTTTGGPPAILSVGNDPAGMLAKVKTITDAYNSVATILASQLTYTGDGSQQMGADTFFGDPAIESLQRQMGSIVASGYSDANGSTSLAEMGITLNNDGTLAVDDTAFTAAVTADPTVAGRLMFGSNGTDGFGAAVDSLVSQFAAPSTGTLPSLQDGINSDIQNYADQIQQIEDQATSLQQRLTDQFSAMDQIIAGLHTQTSALTSLMGG